MEKEHDTDYEGNTNMILHQTTTLSKKFAPATRQSISSSLSRLTPSLSLKRSANLYAPPPVAFSKISSLAEISQQKCKQAAQIEAQISTVTILLTDGRFYGHRNKSSSKQLGTRRCMKYKGLQIKYCMHN